MTSGERAKPHPAHPHPAHQDRNPFDISHRSEEEVAAEIAARLSAWKQARSRAAPVDRHPVDSRPASPPRPPQIASTMVTPGAATRAPALPAPRPQRMPRLGETDPERHDPERGGAEEEPPILARQEAPPARATSTPSLVIETWEDEQAAIAAARIPRLAIPERIAVPMAGRQAARGGTGWAMSLGIVLLAFGVTLPAALWHQPKRTKEATAIAALPASPPGAPSVASPVEPHPFSATAARKMEHALAPYDAPRGLRDGPEIVAAPINAPSALPAVTFQQAPMPQQVPRPFTPNASATANPAHVLIAPPGAAKQPAARLKPVASAAVPPANKAAKPAAQKPKVVNPAPRNNGSVERMFDQLIRTLSNGQPPNPAVQPDPPGTRR